MYIRLPRLAAGEKIGIMDQYCYGRKFLKEWYSNTMPLMLPSILLIIFGAAQAERTLHLGRTAIMVNTRKKPATPPAAIVEARTAAAVGKQRQAIKKTANKGKITEVTSGTGMIYVRYDKDGEAVLEQMENISKAGEFLLAAEGYASIMLFKTKEEVALYRLTLGTPKPVEASAAPTKTDVPSPAAKKPGSALLVTPLPVPIKPGIGQPKEDSAEDSVTKKLRLPSISIAGSKVFNPYASTAKRTSIAGSDDDEVGHGEIAKKMKLQLQRKGIKIVVYYFPKTPTTYLLQPILIDVVDEKSDFTHWLHRTKKWVEVFQNFFCEEPDSENPVRLNRFLSWLSATCMVDPAGGDTPWTKTIVTKNKKSIDIYREVFYGFINNGVAEADMKMAIVDFMQPILTDRELQYCYRLQFLESTQNLQAKELLAPPNPKSTYTPPGNYWTMLKHAMQNNMVLRKNKCMSDVLLSSDIAQILDTIACEGKGQINQDDVRNQTMPAEFNPLVYGTE
jgi:hypothetical protein